MSVYDTLIELGFDSDYVNNLAPEMADRLYNQAMAGTALQEAPNQDVLAQLRESPPQVLSTPTPAPAPLNTIPAGYRRSLFTGELVPIDATVDELTAIYSTKTDPSTSTTPGALAANTSSGSSASTGSGTGALATANIPAGYRVSLFTGELVPINATADELTEIYSAKDDSPTSNVADATQTEGGALGTSTSEPVGAEPEPQRYYDVFGSEIDPANATTNNFKLLDIPETIATSEATGTAAPSYDIFGVQWNSGASLSEKQGYVNQLLSLGKSPDEIKQAIAAIDPASATEANFDLLGIPKAQGALSTLSADDRQQAAIDAATVKPAANTYRGVQIPTFTDKYIDRGDEGTQILSAADQLASWKQNQDYLA
ncbi:MAG: hypothetical protein EBR82_72810, partial [Caulobacteraceae bacterium]|nr:hypothetical protein [Caulobacteraceae bacterium]